MEQKTDLRIVKTKKAIYNAFIRLMNTKGLATMTIQDILDEALINRKTFYTYYRDKYDLAEQVAAGFLERFDAILEKRFPNGCYAQPATVVIDQIYADLYQGKKDLRAIWNIRTDRIDVFQEISRRLQKVYCGLASFCEIPGDIQLQSYMFSNFVLTSYQYIMDTDQTYETHQLLQEYQHLYEVIERVAKT